MADAINIDKSTKSTRVLKEPIDHEGLVNKSAFKGDSLRHCMSWPLIQDQGALLGDEFNMRVTSPEPLFEFEVVRKRRKGPLCGSCRLWFLPRVYDRYNNLQENDDKSSSTDSDDEEDCLCGIFIGFIKNFFVRIVSGEYETEEERQQSKDLDEEQANCVMCELISFYEKHKKKINRFVIHYRAQRKGIPLQEENGIPLQERLI